MPRPTQPLRPLPALAACLAFLALGGCGGSSDQITHIRGSSATITRPMLDHWMRVVVGTDFQANVAPYAPRGLVSEPADDAECATAVKKIAPKTPTGKVKLTDARIIAKCHELHEVIKNQAMAYLLSAQWTMLEAKELGLRLSEAELHKEFLRYRKEIYKTDAKFQKYMAERELSLSDVLYQLRRNVLVTRILPSFQAKVKHAGGGERVYAKLALERFRALIEKTSCKAGYVMEDCREYRAPAHPLPSPAVVLETIVAGG